MIHETPDLFSRVQGEIGMEQCVRDAGEEFVKAAREFIVKHLRKQGGKWSNEALVNACKKAWILPPPNRDDRAFGSVFKSLRRDEAISDVGECPRAKGRGTRGGTLYVLGPKADLLN